MHQYSCILIMILALNTVNSNIYARNNESTNLLLTISGGMVHTLQVDEDYTIFSVFSRISVFPFKHLECGILYDFMTMGHLLICDLRYYPARPFEALFFSGDIFYSFTEFSESLFGGGAGIGFKVHILLFTRAYFTVKFSSLSFFPDPEGKTYIANPFFRFHLELGWDFLDKLQPLY